MGARTADARTVGTMSMGQTTKRPTEIFVLKLRAAPGIDPIRALRGALKVLGRRFGLRAVEVREESEPPAKPRGR